MSKSSSLVVQRVFPPSLIHLVPSSALI